MNVHRKGRSTIPINPPNLGKWKTESDLQKCVVDLCKSMGCEVFEHIVRGKLTHQQGFPKGFPDLMIIDDGEILFVELKRSHQSPRSPSQIKMHERLQRAGAEVLVSWTVSDVVEKIMKMRACRAWKGST